METRLNALIARLSLVSLFVLAMPQTARAQGSPASLLAQAETLYNNSAFEKARVLLTQVTNYKGNVRPAERVEAYKYLGASYAVLGVKDSASIYFVYALDLDPFTTLESTFGGDEQAAFQNARRNIFKAAIDTIAQKAIFTQSTRPESSTYYFHIVTTHSANVKVEIASRTDSSKHETIFNSSVDGSREIPWNGLILTQRADSGIYELKVTAVDRVDTKNPDEKPTASFRISHVYEPLETPLPPLGVNDTLVSRNGRLEPMWDFVKGMSIATVASVGFLTLKQDSTSSLLPNRTTQIAVGVGLGVVVGGVAALFGSNHPNNPVAVAENARKKAAHDAFNAGVARRNAARIARTVLVVRPLTGAGG